MPCDQAGLISVSVPGPQKCSGDGRKQKIYVDLDTCMQPHNICNLRMCVSMCCVCMHRICIFIVQCVCCAHVLHMGVCVCMCIYVLVSMC